MPWGYHLLLEFAGCDTDKITDRDNLVGWVKDLVETIDMKAYGEPFCEDFANHDPAKGGYTVVQLIETSNITAHFVSANGDAFIDIFSCKPFDHFTAAHCCMNWLRPDLIDLTLMERSAPRRDDTAEISDLNNGEV